MVMARARGRRGHTNAGMMMIDEPENQTPVGDEIPASEVAPPDAIPFDVEHCPVRDRAFAHDHTRSRRYVVSDMGRVCFVSSVCGLCVWPPP